MIKHFKTAISSALIVLAILSIGQIFTSHSATGQVETIPNMTGGQPLATGVSIMTAGYGAYNDGTHPTETTAALVAAWNASQAAGGSRRVFIPPGTYKLNATTLTTGAGQSCEIYGVRDASILITNGDINGMFLKVQTNNGTNASDAQCIASPHGPFIHDLTFTWGGASDPTAGCALEITDSNAANRCLWPVIRDCLFINFWQQLYFHNCCVFTAKDTRFLDYRSRGILFDSIINVDQGDHSIDNCYFNTLGGSGKDSTVAGIEWNGGAGTNIRNNKFLGGTWGLYVNLNITETSSENIGQQLGVVTGNYFDGIGIKMTSLFAKGGAGTTNGRNKIANGLIACNRIDSAQIVLDGATAGASVDAFTNLHIQSNVGQDWQVSNAGYLFYWTLSNNYARNVQNTYSKWLSIDTTHNDGWFVHNNGAPSYGSVDDLIPVIAENQTERSVGINGAPLAAGGLAVYSTSAFDQARLDFFDSTSKHYSVIGAGANLYFTDETHSKGEMTFLPSGSITFDNIPTSSSGVPSKGLYTNSNVVTRVP